MDGIVSIANGSSSTIYGCIGYAIKDLIISRFPADYFKYTSVSSEIASRNIRRSFGGNNTKTEIFKREKPFLVLQPTYSVMDLDGPLQNIPLTKNFDNLQYRVDKRYLFEIITDKKYGYNLKFKLNRDRIEFDVTVTTETLHQQLDIYRTILNQIVWERSNSYRMALEAVIPKKMIGMISKYCNMDLEEHEEYIPILLRRLNACSGYPITYKLKNANATDEWFMYYTHNVIVTFTDLNLESGNKKNMVDDSFSITFKVIAEFNLPGVFIIDGNMDQLSKVDVTLRSREYNEENDTYIPLYAISNFQSRFPAELNGMQLYGTTMFQTTAKPRQLEDRIDLSSVLDAQHIRVIRAHKAWNMNPNTLMNVYVMMNNEMLTYDKDYIIDFNTMELVVKKIDNSATYRLIMYFNYETVNEILNNTAYNNNYDVNKLKQNIAPKGIEDGVYDNDFITDEDWMNDHTYENGKVPEDKKDDPETVELEDDPTYCGGGEHRKIDPDNILYKDSVVINSGGGRERFPDKNGLLPGQGSPKGDQYLVEDDPTYCGAQDHDKVNPDDILYKNTVMINNDADNFRAPMKNQYIEGHVPTDKEGVFITSEDEDYYEHLHDHEIDMSELTFEFYDEDEPPVINKLSKEEKKSIEEIITDDITNADIHNVEISTKNKKKFSSKV